LNPSQGQWRSNNKAQHMYPYLDEIKHYYYSEAGNLVYTKSVSEVPEDLNYASNGDAVRYVQKLGCCGLSQHTIRGEYHQLCLDVLRSAVEEYGEVFPSVLRGVRSERNECDSLILFGTTSREVAEFYGSKEIREYRNVLGLRTLAAKSVVTDDYSQVDEEIIFFPEALLH
jgi:NAD-dependent SIR2 family protein deacetylase